MAIVKTKLLRSTFIVYSCWYVIAYLALALWRGHGAGMIVIDYPLSIAVTAVGALVGLYATLGAEALALRARERELKAGHAHQGARLSLGKLPRGGADAAQRKP